MLILMKRPTRPNYLKHGKKNTSVNRLEYESGDRLQCSGNLPNISLALPPDLQSFGSRPIALAVTSDILLEYQEVIALKYGEFTANAFIALLHELPNVQFLTTYYNWNLISADPDDNKYCD